MEHTLRAIASPGSTRAISMITGNPEELNFKGALFYNGIMCSDKIHFATGDDVGPLYVTQKAFALRKYGRSYSYVEPIAVHFDHGITLVYELLSGDVLVRHGMTSGELLYGELQVNHTGMKQWLGQRNFLELPWNATSIPDAADVYYVYTWKDGFENLHRQIKQKLSEVPSYIYRSTRQHWHEKLMHDGSYVALNHGIKLAMSHWFATGTIMFSDAEKVTAAFRTQWPTQVGFGCAITLGDIQPDGTVTDVKIDPFSADLDFCKVDFLYLPILDPAKGARELVPDDKGYYTLPTQHMPTELMPFDDRDYGCHYRLVAMIKDIAVEPEEYEGKENGLPPEPNRYLLGNMWFEVEPRAVRKGVGKFIKLPQLRRVGGFVTLPVGSRAVPAQNVNPALAGGFFVYSATLKLLCCGSRW